MSTRTDREDRPSRIVVGRILGPHGIKGVLKLQPLTDYPERFRSMDRLVVEFPAPKVGVPRAPRELTVLGLDVLESKNLFLVRTEEVQTCDEAESLKGGLVTVAPEDRVPLEEDCYWIDDLLGLRVVEQDTGRDLGRVEDVMSTGSNDVYSVRTPEGVLKMIPAIAEVVQKVDLEEGTLTVVLLEGLWD